MPQKMIACPVFQLKKVTDKIYPKPRALALA